VGRGGSHEGLGETDDANAACCAQRDCSRRVAVAESSFDGEYRGKRVLTKGAPESRPAEEIVSVTIHVNVLTFTNTELQNYAIGFYPEPDGTLTVAHVDSSGGSAEVQGRIAGGVLHADVNNTPCQHHWSLKKK
jgi:hypothetical protein